MESLKERLLDSLASLRRLNGLQKRVFAVLVAAMLLLTVILAYRNLNNNPNDSTVKDTESAANRFGANSSISRLYYVSPTGDDSQAGTSASKPWLSIDKALSYAAPGDTIQLADGDYEQTVSSVRDGKEKSPITIRGSREAVVRGTPDFGRVIEIRHSYLHLEGFTIDGQAGEGKSEEDFRDKLLYVIGSQPKRGVQGLKVSRMLIQNAGGECVRLRYFAVNNEISDSDIRNCGVHDFRFDGGAKNGEGIYIGTAPEQRADGKNPTDDPDVSTGNLIRRNLIETYGNECVDVKEAATKNIIEYNTCRQQRDPESAGFDARGSGNIFRYNTSSDNIGAGFRLGGDDETDGTDNDVYDNTITNNDGGAIKVMRSPQGRICGNNLENNSNKSGEYDVDPAQSCGN